MRKNDNALRYEYTQLTYRDRDMLQTFSSIFVSAHLMRNSLSFGQIGIVSNGENISRDAALHLKLWRKAYPDLKPVKLGQINLYLWQNVLIAYVKHSYRVFEPKSWCFERSCELDFELIKLIEAIEVRSKKSNQIQRSLIRHKFPLPRPKISFINAIDFTSSDILKRPQKCQNNREIF